MKKSPIKTPDLIFVTLLVVLTLVSFMSYIRIKEVNIASEEVNHTTQVNLKLNDILVNIINAETGQRGYLLTLDSSFLIPYLGSKEKIDHNISEIDFLVNDNIQQKKNLKILSLLVEERFEILNKSLQLYSKKINSGSTLKTDLTNGKNSMDQIRKQISTMLNHENMLLTIKVKEKKHSVYITPFYYLLFTLIALMIVTIAYFRLRSEMQLRFKAEDNEAKIQQLQQVTKESEIRFRNIADNVPVMIWLEDTNKLRHFFNKGWLEFTGRTTEEEKGNGWEKGVYPGDSERCNNVYINSFNAKKEFYMEYRLKRHDGEYRWISDKGAPRYTNDGTFLGYAGGCMDIHEQKNFAQ